MQDRPQLVLGHAGLERLAHARHGGLADRDGDVHERDLLGRLDGARPLHELLAAGDLDAVPGQCRGAQGVAVVQGQALVAAAVGGHQVGDLVGPAPGLLGASRAGAEVVPGAGRARLVDGLQARGEVLAVVEIEQHDGPLGRDKAVARGVVHGPHGHVARAHRVADVDRVEQHAAGIIVRPQPGAHAPQPVGAQLAHVNLGLGIGQAGRGRVLGPNPRRGPHGQGRQRALRHGVAPDRWLARAIYRPGRTRLSNPDATRRGRSRAGHTNDRWNSMAISWFPGIPAAEPKQGLIAPAGHEKITQCQSGARRFPP